MSERPNVVLTLLLAAAASIAALVGAGLLVLGAEGVEEMGATLVAAFTACVFFLVKLERIPFSSIVILFFALASAAAFIRVLRSYRRESRLLHSLPLREIEDGWIGERARLAGTRLFVLPSARPAAFCVGLIRPRVIVSTGLLERLEREEQEAVVWHEATHARNYEPLKCLLARLATSTFFWVPALRGLLDRYLLVKELAADRVAIRRTSTPALAGALSQVLAQPTPSGAVGLAEGAAARVDRLFEPGAELPPLVRPVWLLVSGVATVALVLALAHPSSLGPDESDRIWHMVSTMSLHGLPGMLAGLVTNIAVLIGAMVLARRLAR